MLFGKRTQHVIFQTENRFLAKASKQEVWVFLMWKPSVSISPWEKCVISPTLWGRFVESDFTEERYPTISPFWNVRTGLLTR
jgi:hypothetical protein